MLRSVTATRYVTPLREGGSVPALVEADDDGLYVVKLLGAGHGRKALVAELLAGELARHLGLPVPDQVLVLRQEIDAGPCLGGQVTLTQDGAALKFLFHGASSTITTGVLNRA